MSSESEVRSETPANVRLAFVAEAEMSRGTEIILLVEDEAFVRKVTCEVLQSAGYKVVTATNAAEALSQCEHLSQLDLLLTDVVLPGNSGRVLAKILRSERPGLPVLFVTGYPLQLAELAAELAEAYLAKPFSAATLLGKVRGILNGNAARNEGPLIRRACETGLPS